MMVVFYHWGVLAKLYYLYVLIEKFPLIIVATSFQKKKQLTYGMGSFSTGSDFSVARISLSSVVCKPNCCPTIFPLSLIPFDQGFKAEPL